MHGRLFEFQLALFGADYTVPLPSYFVLLLTGFLFATVMGAAWARRVGQNPDVIVDLGLAMLLAGVAGGRLLHVFADGHFWDYVHLCTDPSQVSWHVTRTQCLGEYKGYWDMAAGVCHPTTKNCFAWAEFYTGGFAYYGGFLLAAPVAWRLLKTDRFPFWKAADMAGMVVPIGLGFGRLGCLLAGCSSARPRACRGRSASPREARRARRRAKPTFCRASRTRRCRFTRPRFTNRARALSSLPC